MSRETTTKCPVCAARCRNIRSEQITPQYREVTWQCSNPDCLHVFIAAISYVREVRTSLMVQKKHGTKSGKPG